MTHVSSFDQLVTRIKSEFIEMPGLWLTPEQGARLWAIDRTQCDELLLVLVRQDFLQIRADGKYGRTADDHASGRVQVARPLVDDRGPQSAPSKTALP